ncbi:MAG: hypothetical protein JNK26_04110 [Candidatus Doudnabacteria bacterium]|nr:hypothetical protein [Candidatus Doudnabacteria bacterium]
MEIPEDLQNLYSHWEKHTRSQPPQTKVPAHLEQNLIKEISLFASKRMHAWENKIAEKPRPYSDDPILKNYRFCNIYRELDAQTIQIHQDLLPLKDNFELWLLNLAFHRFVCRPQTVKDIGHLSFYTKDNEKVMQRLQNLSRPKYGTAYVFPISAIQRSPYPTREEFFCLYLPTKIPQITQLIQTFSEETVNSALPKILPAFAFNLKFHWTEILIDIAYQFPDKINLFKDFHIGPGALPTLKRLSKIEDINNVLNALAHIALPGFPYLTLNGKPVHLSAENWEGICCEFRKYSNLRAGQGRRRKY